MSQIVIHALGDILFSPMQQQSILVVLDLTEEVTLSGKSIVLTSFRIMSLLLGDS